MLTTDLKQGFRALRRQPMMSLLAILTLALGIGATTTIFTVVHSVLLTPLPYIDADRLVRVYATKLDQGVERSGLASADFADFAETAESFDYMGSYRWFGLAISDADRPRDLATILVTPGLLAELVTPLMGRTFLPEESEQGKGNVIILGWGLWQAEFGGDESILGQTMLLDGSEYTVVGVMPQGFSFPSPGIELWAPRTYDPANLSRQSHSWPVLGRLAPGVSLETAQQELRAKAAALEEQYPETNAGWSTLVVPLHDDVVGASRQALIALLFAVVLVLAIACANVANLLLARGVVREPEMALRSVLGARRGRLVRQLLTESLVLAGLGGLLGIGLAYAGVASVIQMAPEGLPRLSEIGIDQQILGFAVLMTLITGLGFGILPALRLAGRELGTSLRDGARTDGPRGSHRVRNLITAAQIALSLVLLVGAGLFLKSFLRLVDVDPGFRPERRAALQMFVYGGKYQDPEQQRLFVERLDEELEALPGVRSAAMTNSLPLSPITGGGIPIHVLGRAEPEDLMLGFRTVTADYFETIGTPVLEGRAFSSEDRADSAPVVIVNRAAARRFFPDGDAVGSFLKGGEDGESDNIEIVGIVGDVRHQGLEQEPVPEIFTPFEQNITGSISMIVETENDPQPMIQAIQDRVWAVDPAQSIWGTQILETMIEEDTAQERFQSLLVSLFAVIALVLAAIGLYGVLSYAVAQRTREIGLRMAVGAGTSDILKLVLRGGSWMVGLGLTAGLILAAASAFLSSKVLSPLLFEIETMDPSTFITASLVLAAVGLIACLIPAFRASRIDPIRALQYE